MTKTHSQPMVSVCIPTYKRKDRLIRLVRSIAKSDYPHPRIEIIIVDNGGDISQSDVTIDPKIKIRVVKPNSNLLSSGGRTLGQYLLKEIINSISMTTTYLAQTA